MIYDRGVTLLDTWKAMKAVVFDGRCGAIGLSDVGLNELLPVYEAARIKPSIVQVESHPYLPETELLEFCKANGRVMHETQYFADPFEAPAWRSQWVQEIS